MSTILITGATDGIGYETARNLARLGHRVALHGRSTDKLERARRTIDAEHPGAVVATVSADLTRFSDIDALIETAATLDLDVVINNAGVLRTATPVLETGLDVRFMVNTIAPYEITRRLLPTLPPQGRFVNLSSAAQAPVDLDALAGHRRVRDGEAYAQSKLALTMWSRHLADRIGTDGPVVVAVNPGSLLSTKMVKEGYGVAGHDIGIGVDILTRAATGDDFAGATGRYYDNDTGRFASPHPDALDPAQTARLVGAMDALIPA